MIYQQDTNHLAKLLEAEGPAGKRAMEFLLSEKFNIDVRDGGKFLEIQSARGSGDSALLILAKMLVKLQHEAVGEAFARLPEVKRG